MKLQSEFNDYKLQQVQKFQDQEKLIQQLKVKVQLLQKQVEAPQEKQEETIQQTYQSDNTLTKLNKSKETLAKMQALNAKEYEKLDPGILAQKIIKAKVNNMYLKQSVNALIEEQKLAEKQQDNSQKEEDISIQTQYQELWNKLIQYNKQFSRILSEFKNYENNDMDLLLNDDFVNKIIESKQKVFEMEKQLNEAKEARMFLSLQLEQKAIENAGLRKIIEEEKLLHEQEEIESIDLRTEKTESIIDSKQLFKSHAQQQSLLEKYKKLKPHDQSLEKNEQVCEVCKIF